MAREYARTRISIADDEDIESLSADAQWLYFRVLIPEPTLNYAGVADWRPNRLIRKAQDMTIGRLLAAAAELEQRNYLLFDLETEEVLVRSYIRSDELLRNPKMAASVIKACRSIASRTLRAAVVTEVSREQQEHPEYSSWGHKDTREDLSRLVSRPGLDSVGYTNQITNPDSVRITNGIGDSDPISITNRITNRIGDVDPGADHQSEHQSDSVRIPSNSTMHHSPATMSGYVSPEGHQGDEAEPAPNCLQHPDGTTAPCRACGDARQAREAWDRRRLVAEVAERRVEARRRAEAIAATVAACNLCDDDGYVGTVVCDHDPETPERNRRGSKLVRDALAKAGTGTDAATEAEQ
ncbi:hypothetical protein C8K38_111215 [Rhodococcus sp. OK611]|uniref:hypothetical protein n=1 Tax=unclassified Rhodococcus (in: high G+C Gram-positive bacteria) TaxID=192944 RepID=UPI000BD757D6|nr:MULTISPECIES: hypothetical protein [unclassified Rhodococcus (in: high G+C Gram-positive bacteria)]PTR42046.1 hypothetical protein C8K38_111215 [Rhodococcus sp. OK611]SNX91507.1 hypothetical protein SAMN05447004_11042 [Rhodococcus sp. OK270]